MTRDIVFKAKLNGVPREAALDSRSLLVEAVRELGASGTRVGCLTGDCGACTVLLDGRITKSCLVLAVAASGSEVVTIEGASDPISEGVKNAFIAHKGFQCGYCTSGMIMTAAHALAENPPQTDEDIRRAISGNLCRCTGYDDIVRAIKSAVALLANSKSPDAVGP